MKTVEEIIEHALGLEPGSVKESDNIETVSGWDSLAHLQVLIELDIEFDGKVAEIDQLGETKSVKEIKEILRTRGLLCS